MPAEFESGVTTRELSWHAQETHFADDSDLMSGRKRKALTVDEVLEFGGLDWTVHVTSADEPEMLYFDHEGHLRKVTRAEKRRVVFRVPGPHSPFTEPQDLGTVGSKYAAFMNRMLAEYTVARVKATEDLFEEAALIETAGSLHGGQIVFFCVRTADLLVGGLDPVAKFFTVSSSHDGTQKMRDDESDTRVVCANTLGVAIRNTKRTRSVKHTEGGKAFIENVIAEAQAHTADSLYYNLTFKEVADRMAAIEMSVDDFRKVAQELYPADNPSEPTPKEKANWDMTTGLFNASRTLEGIPNTLWRGFNALTERDQWYSRTRTSKGTDPRDAKAERVLFGKSAQFATAAFDILTAPIDMKDVEKKVKRQFDKRMLKQR